MRGLSFANVERTLQSISADLQQSGATVLSSFRRIDWNDDVGEPILRSLSDLSLSYYIAADAIENLALSMGQLARMEVDPEWDHLRLQEML